MSSDNKVFLKDILDSMKLIEEYVEDMDFEEFKNDQRTIDAVIRNIEIIGEATKQIPDDVKDKNSEIPWEEMARMRDKMIHGYFSIMQEILWETVKHDIPETRSLIKELLEDLAEDYNFYRNIKSLQNTLTSPRQPHVISTGLHPVDPRNL